jgi:hypothetical protein
MFHLCRDVCQNECCYKEDIGNDREVKQFGGTHVTILTFRNFGGFCNLGVGLLVVCGRGGKLLVVSGSIGD